MLLLFHFDFSSTVSMLAMRMKTLFARILLCASVIAAAWFGYIAVGELVLVGYANIPEETIWVPSGDGIWPNYPRVAPPVLFAAACALSPQLLRRRHGKICLIVQVIYLLILTWSWVYVAG